MEQSIVEQCGWVSRAGDPRSESRTGTITDSVETPLGSAAPFAEALLGHPIPMGV